MPYCHQPPTMSFVKLYILMSICLAPFMDMCGLYPTSSSLNIPIFQGSCAAGDRNWWGAAEGSGATSVEASKSTHPALFATNTRNINQPAKSKHCSSVIPSHSPTVMFRSFPFSPGGKAAMSPWQPWQHLQPEELLDVPVVLLLLELELLELVVEELENVLPGMVGFSAKCWG